MNPTRPTAPGRAAGRLLNPCDVERNKLKTDLGAVDITLPASRLALSPAYLSRTFYRGVAGDTKTVDVPVPGSGTSWPGGTSEILLYY
jgi:hypothetical protein